LSSIFCKEKGSRKTNSYYISRNYLEGLLPPRRGIPFGVEDLDLLLFRLEPEEDLDDRDDSEDDRPRRPPRVRLLERDLELDVDDLDVDLDEPEE